jgi:hypothetical protein
MDLSLIKQAAIFAALTDDEIATVAEICKEQRVPRNQYVFKEG